MGEVVCFHHEDFKKLDLFGPKTEGKKRIFKLKHKISGVLDSRTLSHGESETLPDCWEMIRYIDCWAKMWIDNEGRESFMADFEIDKILKKGKCKCGQVLIIGRNIRGKIVTKHQFPMCPEYREMIQGKKEKVEFIEYAKGKVNS